MSPVIWVHPNCLSAANPAFRAHPDAPAVFVWDEEQIEAEQWTLKRLVFVAECLAEMNVTIRRGDVTAEVQRFAREHGAAELVTVADPSPRIRKQAAALRARVLPADPFVDYRGNLDLKRFARYWKRVEPVLFAK